MYDRLLSFVTEFCAVNSGNPIDGEYYDAPGRIVYTTYSRTLPERGRLEVNALAPKAPDSFEWDYEITIKDRLNDEFIHVLLRRDGSLVETYGKTVLEVDEPRGKEILSHLERLSADQV